MINRRAFLGTCGAVVTGVGLGYANLRETKSKTEKSEASPGLLMTDIGIKGKGPTFRMQGYSYVDVNFVLPHDMYENVWIGTRLVPESLQRFTMFDWLYLRLAESRRDPIVHHVWFRARLWLDYDPLNERSLWRLQHQWGGIPGLVVEKGNTFINVGKRGKDWLASGPELDVEPYIQV